ncbi:hypothetical protein [Rhodospira trueperi]|uniref:Uncharacterized protein n=1 Tax=Rhodospira trueperi TaxID=69960 RepID=A0A1G7E3A2_9PROT|nr:hypothetical protein [Rhodospira trueperi]SDE58122.1 hypothetical protein SAMN05421720_108151 [Rhodospira trueperi]
MSQGQGEGALNDVLVEFACCVRDAQELGRRLGYLAAGVEEIIEDVRDFHAAVDSLIAGPPGLGSSRRLRAAMTDDDRQLLREARAARDALMYDFFIDHPIEAGGVIDPAALTRATAVLDSIADTLRRAHDLAARLETAPASNA